MTSSATPSDPKNAGDDRNLVAVDPATALSFEDRVQIFWDKYRTAIFAFCGMVLLGIVAKGAWDYFARQKQVEIGSAYAAATTTEQLTSFSAAHSGHPLAGIAQLRIADEAYAAGKSAEAITGYDKAISDLESGPLAARAHLGLALAKIQGGKTSEGVNELKQLANDAKQLKAIRSEALYHLTSLAVDARNAADAQKASEDLMKLDPMSAWTQRAIALRGTLPAAPVTSTPEAEKKAGDASSGVQINVPGR